MRVTDVVIIVVGGLLFGGCRSAAKAPESTPPSPTKAEASATPAVTPPAVTAEKPAVSVAPAPLLPKLGQEVSLFDGKTLGQWKSTDFGGQGEVTVKDGAIQMAKGSYMTGITWTGPVVRMNYEITLEAIRVEGSDINCGLTFPDNDRPCTLILGGWGGSLCGL
jgi:hypothetical protein